MKNVILVTFMSFLCLATSYAEHRTNGTYSDYRSYESSYDHTYGRNTDQFTYFGGNDLRSVRLVDVKEQWATETRQVRSTCTRRVPVTRRVCRNVRPASRRGPPRGHPRHAPPRRECRNETTYRTESYTCYKPETVRTRRPDKRFHADIDIKFKDLSSGRSYSNANADFVVSLNEDHVSLDLQGQDPRGLNLFFMKDKLNITHHRDVTEITGSLKVLVFNKEEFLSPLNQRIDIRPDVHHGELVIKTGRVQFEKGLGIHLQLESEYGRRSLFSGNVPREYLSIREGRYGDESIIIVDLNRLLHHTLRRGERVDITATLSLNKKNLELLNHRRVPSLEQTVYSNIVVR